MEGGAVVEWWMNEFNERVDERKVKAKVVIVVVDGCVGGGDERGEGRQ